MEHPPYIRLVLTKTTAAAPDGYIKIKANLHGSTKYKYKSTGVKVLDAHWDKDGERVLKSCPDANNINRELLIAKHEVEEAISKLRAAGKRLGIEELAQIMSGRKTSEFADFYQFCRDQIAVKTYSEETRRTYLSEVNKMEGFKQSLTFGDITFAWAQKYEKHMRTKLNNHANTVWKSFKFITTMLNLAVKLNMLPANPLAGFDRGAYKQGVPVYLEWQEVELLHKTVKTGALSAQLRLIGYYALLSYYSGLRYSDAIRFDVSKHVIEDTAKRLLLHTQKTGELVSIAFTSFIAEIVEYLDGRAIKITNQEFNQALKIIAGVAGITKEISSHTGRHSFAMRCAELGMSIDDVQKLLGHTHRSSTEIYFRIKGRRLDEAMSKWEQ